MVDCIGDSMEIRSRTETIIKVISIIILLALNLAVYYNGKDLSCDKCSVNFSFENEVGLQEAKVNVLDLYKSYKEDYCYIEFTTTGISIKKDYGIK